MKGDDLDSLTENAVLCRGMGRSYGDAALPPPGVTEIVGTEYANRMIRFDKDTGTLTAQAGLSLTDLKQVFLPHGWFTPVTPGTQFVTLGGMVGSDVHGKNHHVAGTIGRHVQSLRMRVAGGEIVECSRQRHPDLFCATLGGQGLTGHILDVSLKLEKVPSPWIYQESERIGDIETFIHELKESGREFPFTVGWIDCLAQGENLGRGILIKGRWATPAEAPRTFPQPKGGPAVPFNCPDWLLNDFTVSAFNTAYYWKHWQEKRVGIAHPQPFFYPLDAIQHWNRMYGSRGFTQHQAVIPDDAGLPAMREYVELIAALGGASFLCVIKDCGPEGEGLLSFPKPGMSVALDLPIRSDTQRIVDTLNKFVIKHGGRIYLAKDTFTRPEDYAAMDPRLDHFLEVRRKWDPDATIRSALSVRLFGDRGPSQAGIQ